MRRDVGKSLLASNKAFYNPWYVTFHNISLDFFDQNLHFIAWLEPNILFLVFTKSHDLTTLAWKNRLDFFINAGNKDALSSLGLMPSVRYFWCILAS